MKVKITKDDRIWKNIRKNMLQSKGANIKVGFFEGSRYENGLPVATVARWQEQGTEPMGKNGKGIPPRPFMREGTVQEVRAGNSAQAKSARKALIEIALAYASPKRGRTYTRYFQKAGMELVQLMKKAIRDRKTPPNAPSTIASKGGRDDPLIDTWEMHNSVDYRIDKD